MLQKRPLENIVWTESVNLNGKLSCLLIDGQGLVVSIDKTSCKIFGELAYHFIKSMLWHGNECERIDLVFDIYRDNSIKKSARYQCTKNQRPIRKDISGQKIPVPENWTFLACPKNKSDCADFLSKPIKLKETFSKLLVTSGGFKDELH